MRLAPTNGATPPIALIQRRRKRQDPRPPLRTVADFSALFPIEQTGHGRAVTLACASWTRVPAEDGVSDATIFNLCCVLQNRRAGEAVTGRRTPPRREIDDDETMRAVVVIGTRLDWRGARPRAGPQVFHSGHGLDRHDDQDGGRAWTRPTWTDQTQMKGNEDRSKYREVVGTQYARELMLR